MKISFVDVLRIIRQEKTKMNKLYLYRTLQHAAKTQNYKQINCN